MTDSPYVLVLGTAEWDQAIATNQHYVVRELCRDGFARVDFVESLGLRTPQFSKRDIARIWRRLRRIVSGGGKTAPLGSAVGRRARPEGLTVISPLVLPFHGRVFRSVNRRLLARAVHEWMAYTGPKVLWTYSPVTYGLEDEAAGAFYHCVDLLGTIPGISNDLIARSERRLSEKGVIAAATSEVVQEHLHHMGFRDVLLWKNVADVETILMAKPESTKRYAGSVIFAGNLAPNKVDFALLETLAEAGFDVRVAGPHAEGGGDDKKDFESLLAHGITYLGMLDLQELAQELVRSSVGLIPYKINEYTRGVSPLKTFEYLAAGLAVVSTAVPSVNAIDGHITVVGTEAGARDWLGAVRAAAEKSDPIAISDRVAIAQRHSWTIRGEQLRLEVEKLKNEYPK